MCFIFKRNCRLYTNNYSRVKPENIVKLKHYMHNGLSIYQTKYCETTFPA